MTIATGSKVKVGWVQETSYATPPVSPVLATMPITDWAINTTIEHYQDMSVRGNREHYYDIASNQHVTGDFGIELNGSNFDWLWESVLSSTWTANVGAITSTGTITPGSSYVDGTYTAVPLTGGTGTGAVATVTVSGGGVTAVIITNKGVGYVISDSLSASNTNLGGAGSGFAVIVSTVTTSGSNTIQKQATDTQFSVTAEVDHTDIGLFQTIEGALIDKLSLSVPTNAIVTAKVSLVAKSQTLTNSSISGSPYTAETINQPFVHNGGTLKEGGAVVGYVGDWKLDLDNKYVANFGLGVTTIRAFTPGFLDVSGSIQVFFEDSVMYNKFLNATYSSLELFLTNGTYNIDLLIPKVMYETANKTIKGQQAVILEMNFRGVYDPVTGSSFQATVNTL